MSATLLARVRQFFAEEREVIAAFIASRLLLWFAACFAYLWLQHGDYVSSKGLEPWNLLFRWDANWYLAIIEQGYFFTPGAMSSVAFFPLYPLIVQGLSFGVLEPRIIGVLFSNACLLGAVILIRRYAAMSSPEPSRVPMRTVLLLLFFPVSFFHSALYTESLFLLLSAGSLLWARRGHWLAAGLAGCLLTATRTYGILILPALVWEAWVQIRETRAAGRPLQLARYLWIGLTPGGLVAYMTFLYVRFGNPLAFVTAQAAWGRRVAPPWESILQSLRSCLPGYAQFYIAIAVIALTLCAAGFFLRLRASLLIFTALTILLALSSNLLESFPRYASSLFALPLAAAVLTDRRPVAFALILAVFAGLLGLCTAVYAIGFLMT